MPEPLDAGTSQVAPTQEAAPVQGQQTQQAPAAPQGAPSQGGGNNPAWDELRNAVGDTTFALIRPHITKFDQAANERISSLSGKLDGYTAFGEPDQITQWQQLAQAVDSDPLAFYEQYGSFLREQGLIQDDTGDAAAEDDPFSTEEEDPRFAQLQQQNEAILEQIQAQEFEKEVASESQKLEQTLGSLREGNPWMDDSDVDQIVARARALMQAGMTNDPVGAAATEYIGLRNKFMTAPRSNDFAPKLIPTGGGNPASGQQPDVGKLSPQQRQALVAQMLSH